jgi:hypothetical protein
MYGLIGKVTSVPGQRDALAAVLLGKRSAYGRVLRRVRDVAPEERDALPNKGTKQTKRG